MDHCHGQALGDQGWRGQYLPTHAWVVVAGCGDGVGSVHEPHEVPNTLFSHQTSKNVEQCVTETPTHGYCAPPCRDPAVPVPTDTST